MSAITLTAISAFEVVCFRENNESIGRQVIIFFLKFIVKRHNRFRKSSISGKITSFKNHFPSLQPQNLFFCRILTPLYTEPVHLPLPSHNVSVLRLDRLHPVTGGNKQFKLKYNLDAYSRSGKKGIVTIGGAYSNHIAATAAVCMEQQIACIGIIRGEESNQLSTTLVRARAQGMQLQFVSRTAYRKYRLIQELESEFPDYYCIPEGGNNAEGVKGCEEILLLAEGQFDIIVTGCGTGATLAGIIRSLPEGSVALGINVTKSGQALDEEVKQWTGNSNGSKFSINHDYHFGGYAKKNEELLGFIKQFNSENTFAIEPVYTGKVFYAITNLLRKGELAAHAKVLVLHTGGLQYLL